MPVSDICDWNVVTLLRTATVAEADKQMRHAHVGAVVVVDHPTKQPVPIGIVTDRDIIIEVIATGLNPEVITLDDIMSDNLVVGEHTSGIFEAIERMASKGVRRLPLVDSAGALVGIVTMDDLYAMISDELACFSKLLKKEQKNEFSKRR